MFISSALDNEVLEEAGLANVGTFLAVTNNGEVNAVVAQQASDEFQPPRVLAIYPSGKPDNKLPAKTKVQQAFMPEFPIKTWNGYLTDGAVKLGQTTLRQPGVLFQQAHLKALMRSGELIPLLVERGEQLLVAAANHEWQAGDRIIYLLHDPKPKLLKRLSGGKSPARLVVETLPEVEEAPVPNTPAKNGTSEANTDAKNADSKETSKSDKSKPTAATSSANSKSPAQSSAPSNSQTAPGQDNGQMVNADQANLEPDKAARSDADKQSGADNVSTPDPSSP